MDDLDFEREHEAQTSELAARPGALLLDYLRVRLPDDAETWLGLQVLGPQVPRGGGWHGWYDRSALVAEGGIVASCHNRARAEIWGVLVDLPGRACAALGDRLLGFLSWCLERGKVTRCDFAIDDRAGRLTRERILTAEAQGLMVSRWRGLTILEQRERGAVKGWTVYLGSRNSEALIRVYDKAGEQARKGTMVPGPWVRLELEAHQEFADALCRAYFEQGSGAVVGQIARRVRFVMGATRDSNKWRWPVAPWWAEVLGSVTPGPSLMVGEVPECTVERMARFIEHQAGPSMAAVVAAHGGDLGQLAEIVERSRWRMRPQHKAALEAYLDGVAPDLAEPQERSKVRV